MNTMSSHSEGLSYYGWRVLAAVFIAEMFAFGSTSYAFTLFVVPVSNELGLARATVNFGLMLILVGMGLGSPVIGRLLDRFTARSVLVGGAIYMGLGFIVLGLSSNAWIMAAVLLLVVGPGAAAIGILTAATVVSRWFERLRGRALGVAAVATSLGGAVLVPAIGMGMSVIGWRGALLIQGVGIAVLVSLVSLLVVREPPGSAVPERKAEVDGDALRESDSSDGGWRLSTLLRNREFWSITIAVGLTYGVLQAVLVSLVPLGTGAGMAKEQAALLVSLLGVVAVAGKLAFGVIADRINKRDVLLAVAIIILLEVALLWAYAGLPMLVTAVVLGGIAVGGELPVWQALVAERFGKRSYGTVLGVMQLLTTACCGTALYYVGHVYDVTGSYERAFLVFMIAVALAIASALVIPANRRRARSATVIAR